MKHAAASTPEMTVDDFVAFNDGTDTRYELIAGTLVAMAPPSFVHATITGNLAVAIGRQLRPPCRVRVEYGLPIGDRNYFQADLAIVCGDARHDEPAPPPTALIEIVSPSSLDHDSGRKLMHYRQIEACRSILLVDAERAQATSWTRQGAVWIVQDLIGMACDIALAPDVSLRLAEAYAGVIF